MGTSVSEGTDAAAAKEPVRVTMLGKFAIRKGTYTLSQTGGRAKQVWLLIEYLLAHRRLGTSAEKLIEVFWGEDDPCGNPMNTLKNLVYRARTMLQAELHDGGTPFILYSRGSYLWNPDLPCTVDAEEMERLAKAASAPGLPKERRLVLLKKAAACYGGDFLPDSGDASWVVSRAAYFSSLYINCVLKLCALYREKQKYGEIIALCEEAIVHVPFEESVHSALSYAYLGSGQSGKALQHYNYMTDFFYRELGVDVSGDLRELYRRITTSIHEVETNLSAVQRDLREAAVASGAFFCTYETFRNLYRVQARALTRSGESIYVALLSLLDGGGNIPKEPSAAPVIALFKEDILLSLRRGDVVAPYSSAQFIVMLPMIDGKNAEKVMRRIIRRFEGDCRKDDTKIIYKLGPVEPAKR